MRVDVWSYYSVDRPPVKFHRIRRSFDAPTDNYSGSIAGLTSDVFGLRKQMSGPLSLFSPSQSRHSPPSPSSFPSSLPELSDATARSETLSSQCIEPLARVWKLSRTRPEQSSPLCPDHPQTSTKHLRFLCWTLLAYFSRPYDLNRRAQIAPNLISMIYIYIDQP